MRNGIPSHGIMVKVQNYSQYALGINCHIMSRFFKSRGFEYQYHEMSYLREGKAQPEKPRSKNIPF